jgi:O-acetyl-ADP-ribose deacetylase (regulator of RNase III)
MKGRSVRVTVWSGIHKGKTGVLTYGAKNGKGTIVVATTNEKNKVELNVNLKDCQQMKIQKKVSVFGKESDSEYNTPVPRVDRQLLREEKKTMMEFLDFVKTYFFQNLSSSIYFKPMTPIVSINKGFMAMYMGGVLDQAFRHPLGNTAIGNAANTDMRGGGGLDGVITRAGGDSMRAERKALPPVFDGERGYVGGAIMTTAGDINADYVIHAVGPNFHCYFDTEDAYNKLFDAYWNMLTQPCNFIAIPLLSGGIFRAGEPLETVIGVGLLAINAYMQCYGNKIAVLCAYTSEEQAAMKKVYAELFSETNNKGKTHFINNLLRYPRSVKYAYRYAFDHGKLYVPRVM